MQQQKNTPKNIKKPPNLQTKQTQTTPLHSQTTSEVIAGSSFLIMSSIVP